MVGSASSDARLGFILQNEVATRALQVEMRLGCGLPDIDIALHVTLVMHLYIAENQTKRLAGFRRCSCRPKQCDSKRRALIGERFLIDSSFQRTQSWRSVRCGVEVDTVFTARRTNRWSCPSL